MNTVNEFVKQLEELKDHEVFSFWDPEGDGGCPCFGGTKRVGDKKVSVHGRCWRVSDHGDQDLYVWGDFEQADLERVAKETKRALDETEWYNPYTVVYEKFE